MTITLSLYLNSKLEQYFPNDPYSDMIVVMNKNYKLQKAYLRLESDYFSESFESENVNSNQLLIIHKKFEVALFEKILRCFYGGKAIIHQNEIYGAFEICQYLRSNSLIAQMVEQLVKNFENLNFFMVYSIGFLYSNDELLEKCFTFLRETNFKAMIEEWVYASKPNNKFPNSIYSLAEDSFKNLIKMHNQLKFNSSRGSGFLSFHEIYNIIKTYVLNNHPKNEQNLKLKEMVVDLIDKNQLNSKEYKLIYHQDLFLIDDEKAISNEYIMQSSKTEGGPKYSKTADKLDLITSENFLFRKEMEELRNDNSILLAELKVLKENFLKSQLNLAQYEEKYNEILNKFNEVKNDLANSQIKAEMRFYQMEMMMEELRNDFSKPNSEDKNNFYRTLSEKTANCPKRKSENLRFPEQLNRKSTEETKASKNDLISIQSKEEKMRLDTKNNKISHNNNVEFAKHSLSAESFLVAKKMLDFGENHSHAIPTYSVLKQKSLDKPAKEKKMDEIMKKIDGFNKIKDLPENANTHDNFDSKGIKNINTQMKNICLEPSPEDATHESFFFLDREPNLNNTMLSNYSQIINPALLTAHFNYETNYKNTVLVDIQSQFLKDDCEFNTLKKWFDVKLYQKLKLHLLFKGTRDSFKIAALAEKTEGISPILVFFSAKELETEIFGGFLSEHSDQGFAFELRKRVRIEFSINKEEEKGFLICFGKVVRITENGDREKKNVLMGELMDGPEEEEFLFTVKEIEVFQVLIDSEMDI